MLIKEKKLLAQAILENENSTKEEIINALELYPLAFKLLSQDLKQDDEIIRFVLNEDGLIFNELDIELRKKKEYVILALRSKISRVASLDSLDFPEELIQDRDIILELVENSPKYILLLDDSLPFFKEVLLKAVENCASILYQIEQKQYWTDREVLEKVEYYHMNTEEVNEESYSKDYVIFYENCMRVLISYRQEEAMMLLIGDKKNSNIKVKKF